jgi:hypothetical protein
MSIENYSESPEESAIAKKQKSRNQSIFEFCKTLQLECIVAELRTKIYPKIKDKEFWKGVYENKRLTILDIASRNRTNNHPLPTIFTDDDMLKEYKDEIFGEGGFPKFIYKDETQEYSQGYLDHNNYYAKGVDVLCNYFNEPKIGKVKFHQANSHTVTVLINKEEVILPIKDVTRIL